MRTGLINIYMSFNRFKIFIITVIVLVGAGIGLGYYFNRHNPETSGTVKPETSLNEDELNNFTKPVNLTSSVKEKLDADLKKYQDMADKGDTGGEKNMMRTYLALGQTYEYFGELGKARQAYMKAAQAEPGSAIPIVNLGVVYESMGQDDLAGETYKLAIIKESNWPRTWQAWITFNVNKLNASTDKVKSLYQQALQATGNDVSLHKDYAAYLETVGEKLNSLSEWQAIGKIYPDDATVKEQIQRLSK